MSGGKVGGAERIAAAIKDLNYRPNQLARGLRSGRHSCVGVIVPDITNPLFAALVDGIESVFAPDNIRVLLANSREDPVREAALVADLVSRTDGLILIPPIETDPVLDQLAPAGVPTVLVDRVLSTGPDVDSVVVDNRRGAQLAAEHLISLGHIEIAVISGPLSSTPGRERHEAFLQALSDFGQAARPEHVRLSDFSVEGGYKSMASLLDQKVPPTAVFCANNLMTIGALRLLRARAVALPDALSLIGFDDLDLSELMNPPLTVIDRATFTLGSSAAELLRARLATPDREQQHLTLPVRLVVRGSTSAPTHRSLPRPSPPVPNPRGSTRPAVRSAGSFSTSQELGVIVSKVAAKVVVVGSITADVTAFGGRLPVPGETVIGESFTLVLGGKGANQALAAARAGASATMIGCVGTDLFRDIVLGGLRDGGVDTSPVTSVPGPTGVAHIRVDNTTGQNDIVIVPLANSSLTSDLAERQLREVARSGDVLLLQLEIPLETAFRAAAVGRELGMTVVLDPAPAAILPDEIWPCVDVVTPNEVEATVLTGLPVSDADAAAVAGRWFLERGVRAALITLGEKGVVEVSEAGVQSRSTPTVDVVDTTAAGDAFTGNLGAGLANGHSWDDSVIRGIYAGALAVTVAGASTSLPTADAVDAFIGAQNQR
jgi:ribokinase